jgi:actin-like ATPase involved in cell morphogenesis
MYALGIDLGTTFTAAATWRNGHAETQSLGSRAAAIPSVVLLRDDETFLTGEGANRRGLSEPHRVAREFKRRLGDTTPILLGGVPYSAEALMARLLRSVVDEVATREGGKPAAICISHPANWGPYKTDLLRQAIRLAGLEEPVTLTTEPEAAAVFYAHQQRIEPGAIVAVYDLGGGTFDAAVLRKTPTGFEILGQPEGIERLGGIDFDAAVFSHVSKALGGKLAELDEDDPSVIAAVARLREECVGAKEALSSDTDVSIPVLLPNVSTEIRLTRSELEAMVRPALHDSIEALKRALRSARVTPDQLHAVLLVGGSSRMPIVAQLVGAELGRPVAVDAHPKHAVALGAAWLASGSLAPAAGAAGSGAAARAAGSAAVAGTAASAASATPAAPAQPRVIPGTVPVGPPPPAVPVASSVGPAPVYGSSVGSAPGQAPSAPREPATSEFGATEIRPGGLYGAPPAAPAPSPPSEAAKRRGVMLIGGVIGLVLVLVLGGLAWALLGAEDDPGQEPLGNQATGTPGPAATSAPPQPADEQCTDQIKANTRWVCLTKATFDGTEIRIEYQAEDNGRAFDISGGFHLHIYGANEDGSDPPDQVMGTHSSNRGAWYVEDQNPSVHGVGSNQFETIEGFPKVCARIATSSHQLVEDKDGNYKTGNCVKVEQG